MPDPTPRTPWQMEAERQRAEAALPPSGDLGVDALRIIAFLRSCIESGERLTNMDREDADAVVARLLAAPAVESLTVADGYAEASAICSGFAFGNCGCTCHNPAILAALTGTEPKP